MLVIRDDIDCSACTLDKHTHTLTHIHVTSYTQDDYRQALIRLHQTVTRAYQVNSNIKFEVFIHKVDGLADDRKIEAQRDIHQRATDDLADAGLDGIHLSFYLTSIYDHSIFEVGGWHWSVCDQ